MSNHISEDQLNRYVGSELPEGQVQKVALHLSGCVECRETVVQLQSLLAEARRLPRSILPGRDLRSGIHARIRAKKRVRFPTGRRPSLAAAAVVVVAAAGVLTSTLVGRRSAPPDGAGPVRTSPMFTTAEVEYVRATEALEAVLDERRRDLPPEVRAGIDASLQRLDRTIRTARAEMTASPGDVDLMLAISATYRQKMDVLHGAIQLTTRE